jgi:hypothetical protein
VSASASKQVLGRHVLVAECLRLVLGFIEDLIELARQRRLRVGLFRISLDLAGDLLAQPGHIRAELLQDGNDDALLLIEERAEQVEILDDGVSVLASGVDGFVQRLAGLYGELLRIDHADSVSNVGASQLGQCGRPVKLHQTTLAVCRCRFDGSARGETKRASRG